MGSIIGRMNTSTDLKEAAAAAIKKLGGPKCVADKIGILPWAVSKWRKKRIPAERVPELIKAFPDKISRHELRPDLYAPEQQAS